MVHPLQPGFPPLSAQIRAWHNGGLPLLAHAPGSPAPAFVEDAIASLDHASSTHLALTLLSRLDDAARPFARKLPTQLPSAVLSPCEGREYGRVKGTQLAFLVCILWVIDGGSVLCVPSTPASFVPSDCIDRSR